jgi:hypothetical protein
MLMEFPTGGSYEYLYWQAQASGKLLKIARNSDETQAAAIANRGRIVLSEAALRVYFDYWSCASNLWNYIGYKYLFTVFNFLKTPPERFFEARINSRDQEGDVPPIPERFTLQEQSMQIVRTFFNFSVERDAKGELWIKPVVSDAFIRDARGAFPNSLKSRTLVILTYNAPYFTQQLSKDEYAAYEFAFFQGKSWLQKAGYHSVVIGPHLINDDFEDRGHLTGSGGQKMAHDVAPLIREMAIQLGYLPVASAKNHPYKSG